MDDKYRQIKIKGVLWLSLFTDLKGVWKAENLPWEIEHIQRKLSASSLEPVYTGVPNACHVGVTFQLRMETTNIHLRP